MLGNLSRPLIWIESRLRRRMRLPAIFTHHHYHRWALDRTPRFVQTLAKLRTQIIRLRHYPVRIYVSDRFFQDYETSLPCHFRFTSTKAMLTGTPSLMFKGAEMFPVRMSQEPTLKGYREVLLMEGE